MHPFKQVFIIGIFLILLTTFANALTVTVDSEKHDLIDHEIVFKVDTMGDTGNISKAWDFNLSNLESRAIVNPHYYLKELVTKQRTVSVTNQVNCDPQKIATYTDSNGLWAYCWNKNNPKPTDTRLYACQNATGTICYENVVTTETQNYDVEEWVEQAQPSKKKEGNKWILGIPAKEFKKNEIKYIKLTYDIPISTRQWGSTGNWSMNPTSWWDTNWTYKQVIKIKTSDMNLNANITQDHAILIDINSTNTNLWTNINRGANCGTDIRFVNADDNTNLAFHTDDRNLTSICDTNRGLFWVKITDTFTKLTDLNISLYYKNSSATSGVDINGTYPSSYKAVFHMGELVSSTGNNYTLTAGSSAPTKTITNCKIGSCYAFAGNANSYFKVLNPILKDMSSDAFTFLAWDKVDVTGNALYTLWGEGTTTANHVMRQTDEQDPGGDYCTENVMVNATIAQSRINPPNCVSEIQTLHHFESVNPTAGGTMRSFQNGGITGAGLAMTSISTDRANYTKSRIGGAISGTETVDYYFNGTIDEIQILDYVLSEDELKLKYKLENANSGFVVQGTQQTSPVGTVPIDMNLQVLDIFDNLQLINSMDCNSSLVTYSNQQSPYIKTFTDTNKNYVCTFTATGYDSNTVTIYTDTNNKLTTIYLTDNTAPVVGSLITHDYNIYSRDRNYIKGTGYYTATFSHPGHPVNTCAFTIDNNVTWNLTGIVTDNNLCTTPSFPIVDDQNYNVRIRVTDESLNSDYSNTVNYFGDVQAPLTSISYFQIANTTDLNVTLTCNDFNKVGCRYLTYNIDSLGWINLTPDNKSVSYTKTAIQGTNNTTPVLMDTYLPTKVLVSSTIKTTYAEVQNLFNNTLGSTAYSFLRYYYTDGTDTNTAIVNSPGANIELTLAYANSNPTKDLNKIELYLYSTPASGTAIFRGWRVDYNEVFTELYDVNTTNFLVSGVGSHSIQHFGTDWIDNNESIKSSLLTSYGQAHFYLYDENTGASLQNVSVLFNGTTTDFNSSIDFNLQGLPSGDNNFVFSKTGYSTRIYQFDLNDLTTDLNVNFALRNSNATTSVPFKFYQNNQTSLYANTYVTLKDVDTNYVIGQRLTNSLGEATFILNNNDSRYYTFIEDGNVFSPVALTILYPKNEATLLQIIENWNVQVSNNNLTAFYTNLNTSQVIYLLPNTSTSYAFIISDMNSNYFLRNYSLNYIGNPITATLQPYLVSIASGLLTTIFTKDAFTSAPVPNITIKVYKNIAGIGKTLLEQVTTDSKGQSLVLLVLASVYEFEVYNGITLLDTYNVTATSNTIYIYIKQNTNPNPFDVNSGGYGVVFTSSASPISSTTGYAKKLVGAITFTKVITNISLIPSTCISQVVQNGVILATTTTTCNTLTTTINHVVNWSDINAGVVTNRIYINGLLFQQNYYIISAGTYGETYNIFTGLTTGLRSDLACSATGWCYPLLAVAILISIILVIGLTITLGQFQSQSSGLIFAGSMALFTYLNWIPIELMAGIVLIMLAFLVNERRE